MCFVIPRFIGYERGCSSLNDILMGDIKKTLLTARGELSVN